MSGFTALTRYLAPFEIVSLGIVEFLAFGTFVFSLATAHWFGILFGAAAAAGFPVFLWWIRAPHGRASR